VADRPLRPAIDRRLGEPLPHQLANRTQAPLLAINLSLSVFQLTSLCGISHPFGWVSPTKRQVTYALLTRPPLGIATSFDLHVLSTPPAFVLSQDQTLRKIPYPHQHRPSIKRNNTGGGLLFEKQSSSSFCPGHKLAPMPELSF
jgi:hypothetical protein